MRFLGLFGLCCLALAGEIHATEHSLAGASRELLLPTEHSLPAEVKWVNGYLVLIHRKGARFPAGDDDSVAVLSGDGRELFWRSPGRDVPEATRLAAERDATVTPGGMVIVATELWNAAGQRGPALIHYRLSDGALLRTTRTSPIYCRRLAADDSAIWCMGYDVPKQMAGASDYDILYRFSPDGRPTASHFARSSYPRDISYFADGETGGFPWVTLKGQRGHAWLPAVGEMLTWSKDGSELGQFPVSVPGADLDEPRIGADGSTLSLIAVDASVERTAWRRRLSRWDPGSSRWLPQASALPDVPVGIRLVDVDGDMAVLWNRYSGSIVFHTLRSQ